MKRPLLTDPLLQKCRVTLGRHRQRARADGAQLDYGAADLVALARGTVQCCWCKAPVSWDHHFDHVTPPSRGGAHRLANIVVACGRCNTLKGMLTGPEFLSLLQLLRQLHPVASADLRRRLLAGGRRYAGKRSGSIKERE
jgi:5-methylcytosine-specific restriction endonuclease McrA